MSFQPLNIRQHELISFAWLGQVTPEQAEAEAAANGWEPFAQQPELPAFDPMQANRWSMPMVLAWIAWRDPMLVRRASSAFASQSTHWVARQWNRPADDGRGFERHSGWFLEPLSQITTVGLRQWEIILRSKGGLPATAVMSILEAQAELWKRLVDLQFVAEAIGADGKPVDVPARDWSYLNVTEHRHRDVLIYRSGDLNEPFREVQFKRDDVLHLWPPLRPCQVNSAIEPRECPSELTFVGDPAMRQIRLGSEVILSGMEY